MKRQDERFRLANLVEQISKLIPALRPEGGAIQFALDPELQRIDEVVGDLATSVVVVRVAAQEFIERFGSGEYAGWCSAAPGQDSNVLRLQLQFTHYAETTPENTRKFGSTTLAMLASRIDATTQLQFIANRPTLILELPFRQVTAPVTLLPKARSPSPAAPMAIVRGQSTGATGGNPNNSILDIVTEHREKTRPLSVLVADDKHVMLGFLQRMIREAGHRASGIERGDQILETLKSQSFDVLLLDVHMPVVNGIDVLKTLKNEPALKKPTGIIMMSADESPATRAQCLELGARAFLRKPVDFTELFATFEKIAKTLPDALPINGLGGGRSPLETRRLDDIASISQSPGFVSDFVDNVISEADGITDRLRIHRESNLWPVIQQDVIGLKGLMASVGAVVVCETLSMLEATSTKATETLWDRYFARLEGDIKVAKEMLAVQIETINERAMQIRRGTTKPTEK